MMRLRIPVLALVVMMALPGSAQYAWQYGADPGKEDLGRGLDYKIEFQGSYSEGNTPLWLNANRYGLSSLREKNGYVRGSLLRPLSTDSARRWGLGWGVDLVRPVRYTSRFVVQQAFAEVRWLHGVLTVGSKEYPMQLKNNRLSSGSQTLGINARPVPQIRLAVPEYWTVPMTHHWLHFKGHIAYGKFTDSDWQKDFTQAKSRFTEDVLYHSKAGYLKIGNEDAFAPLSLEMGLEMATQFGGTSYRLINEKLIAIHGGTGIADYWHALVPAGQDATDGIYGNIMGNQLGSWVMRVNYDAPLWALHVYADHFFEDHSQMFLLDYDGYETGENWHEKKRNHMHMYKLKDMMLGMELNLRYGTWLRNIVFEYLYTKYQSGPYNHDHTMNIADHVAGIDNYYNHSTYAGWQHWGQVMGNPLYRSPIYNTDGQLMVKDNRFTAFHLGIDGSPAERLSYRLLASWQEGLGTYDNPYTKIRHNVSVMLESSYHFHYGWAVRGAFGMDFGSILGRNTGFQLTVSKTGTFNL
ncbi:MAG: capsule assembly Wzi family protein [Prevotella sp.]|nr:capsule assembly Wzi family protein [Prevotella sp.]